MNEEKKLVVFNEAERLQHVEVIRKRKSVQREQGKETSREKRRISLTFYMTVPHLFINQHYDIFAMIPSQFNIPQPNT